MTPDFTKPLKILVVEDEPVNSKLLGEVLSDSPLFISEVGFAETAGAASKLLRDDHFDIVLLDLNLPDSKGLDTLRAINDEESGEESSQVAIVVITGEYGEHTGLKAIARGAQEYLVKGRYDTYTLSKSIYYAIERKWAEQLQRRLLDKIESANEELKSFAYIVSHDLKAPLRGIRNLADWISADYGDKLGSEGKKQLELLGSQVDRMHDLIEAVLQYSKIGYVKEARVEVDLDEFLPEVVETVVPAENITVTIENELPTVLGEQTRFQQLFQNLLSNAVKYMDKPEGKIRIGCVEENDFWKFSIADNGLGIEEKDFVKIFEMFQTLSAQNEYESMGVGLTVAKKIVELYGGRIWVESEYEQGSTFFFTLPKQKMEAADAKLQTDIIS